jgi:hypothetical protein
MGGTPLFDPLYQLTDGYGAEHDAMIRGFFPNAKDKDVIQEVMRLYNDGRLRAFAENPSNRQYPRYMIILVPHVVRGKT